MLYEGKQCQNVHLSNYSEAYALQELLVGLSVAIGEDLERMDAGDYTGDQFQIIVGNKVVAFFLGGPQADALYSFVDHLASENFYNVNIEKCEVTDHV